MVKSRSHHDVAHLHPLTNVPTKYQLPTPLRFLRYSPDKLFPATHPPTHPDTMGENNTPTAVKGCWGTTSLLQPSHTTGSTSCSYRFYSMVELSAMTPHSFQHLVYPSHYRQYILQLEVLLDGGTVCNDTS